MTAADARGVLYVVATPIGNLEDLTPRAIATLRSVATIACEDTRRTGRLLARLGVTAPMTACHKFNERERLAPLLATLREGRDVALVSDGGTPCISDPGALLVRAAHDEGLRVVPIPGPSALAALLSASGLPADRFVFEGFLPHREGQRRRRLRELRSEARTIVLFESPHRIRATLGDLAEVFGPRRIVLGRELTKLHETIVTGTPAEVDAALGSGVDVPGEIVVAIEGAPSGRATAAGPVDTAARRVRDVWTHALDAASGDRRTALRNAARELGLSRAELQRRLAEIGEG